MGIAHLCKGDWVKLVLGGELKATSLLRLHIVTGLGTNLDGGVDLLVVACGNQSQVLGADNAGNVAWGLVTDTERVSSHSSLLHIVTSLTTDEEAVRASDNIDNSVDVALSSRVVEESAGVDVGVLEGEVDLLGGGALLGRVPEILDVNLDAWSNDIGQLDLAVEERCGGPRLGDSHTFTIAISQPEFL